MHVGLLCAAFLISWVVVTAVDATNAVALSPLLRAPYALPLSKIGSNGSSGQLLYVDCKHGNDGRSGAKPEFALRSLKRALQLSAGGGIIHVSGGICPLTRPVNITARHSGPSPQARFVIAGDGRTALSGGAKINKWSEHRGDPGVLVADVPTSLSISEIKSLRVGTSMLARSLWPKRVGPGNTTPNFMFAMPWSNSTGDPAGGRTLQYLGVDPTKLPNVSLASAYVHVYGCVEKDVNSQKTRVLGTNGTLQHPQLGIMFRNSFTVNQRFQLENIEVLAPGEFFHDEEEGRLLARPATNVDRDELLSFGAVAPVTDTLVTVRGASHVVIANLTYLDTTYNADGYWDGPGQQPSDAAVRINYARDVHVESSNFLASLGGYGVVLGNATCESSVVGSLFDHVGQGGVFMFGYDSSPVGAHDGAVAGNNTQPRRIEVAHNVMSDLGQFLVHVAGVALRAGSQCHIHHNRISHVPRYGLQADSFYVAAKDAGVALNSHSNLLEFNILRDTCRYTTDTGAIEMLGSGDPAFDGQGDGFFTNTTVRWNNISETVGSSSSDGQHVCVHGQPAAGCRGLVWGIYLDGGQSGVTVTGNVIGATLHGAIFDNAGGNNTHTNNIFLGDDSSSVLMDFGAPASSVSKPNLTRSVLGSTVQSNIFVYTNPTTAVYGAQVQPFYPELKPSGSDRNLFWSTTVDASFASSFPGGLNFTEWQGKANATAQKVLCSNTRGPAAVLTISTNCSSKWSHNATDQKLYLLRDSKFVLNLDCAGDYKHCSAGDSSTRVCLDTSNGWNPPPLPPPRVDNQGWIFGADGTVRAAASKKCLEVCHRGGAVGGCDGEEGSVLQLNSCAVPPSKNQIFALRGDGALTTQLVDGRRELCARVPVKPPLEPMDLHSRVADPLFVDAASGNFSLTQNSPAFGLGFRPIPAIEAPTTVCGTDAAGAPSCLRVFFRSTFASSHSDNSIPL